MQDNLSVLPIYLSSFTGSLSGDVVVLNWKVSESTNFERFEVERSLDGTSYNKIKVVPFDHSLRSYAMQDDVSVLQSKQVYYRLKLVDEDGKFSYSKVIVFKISQSQKNIIVYPNPARTELFVSLASQQNSGIRINILDASGRILAKQRRQIQVGNNVFPLSTAKLKGGNYVLQILVNGEIKTSRFTILK